MDNLTTDQRRRCMSRVRNRNTDIESSVRSELFRKGWRFRKNVSSLPGSPDIVFARQRVAVFIDGDFWHGYRFPLWKPYLSSFWKEKIERNRRRDRRNFAKLRRLGWRVIRIWQHEIKSDLTLCLSRLEELLSTHDQIV
jgi:DNA mismatch endonuclease (patch repair protein)